ncbi:MAG: hypothetical protein LBH00_10610 [Planctomycetaceae bacterium]|jgi:hypothetical protein|nr:hypothetical protein [Planctomycetaceae bacterium]
MQMQRQWLQQRVLCLTGLLFLAGQSFGGELPWKKPADSDTAVVPAFCITAAEENPPVNILSVQALAPVPPRVIETAPMPLVNPPAGASINQPPVPADAARSARLVSAVPCSEKIKLKSLKDISHDIRPKNAAELPPECILETEPYSGRHFAQTCFQWKASAVCTKGAYFEDVQLERYGHTACPLLQPVISGAKFFVTVPLLPYKMGVTPPTECVYTLGHYRAGSCAPYMIDPFPISIRGALFEAGAVTGAILAIP